jgi:hypothetical protein
LLVFFSLKNTCTSCQVYSVEQNHTPEAQFFNKMIFLLWHYKDDPKSPELESQGFTKAGTGCALRILAAQPIANKLIAQYIR